MVDEIEREFEESSFGSMAAVILTACTAALLAALPASIALHAQVVAPGWLAGAAGVLAVVIAIGKLAAMAWGACSHLWDSHRASVAAAYAD
jgi:hypothetical protein